MAASSRKNGRVSADPIDHLGHLRTVSLHQNRGFKTNGTTNPAANAAAHAAADRALHAAIGHQVKMLRHHRNLTLTALGQLTNLSPSALSNLENGLISPTLARLRVVADALDVPLAAILPKVQSRRRTSFVPAADGILPAAHRILGNEFRPLAQFVGGTSAIEPYLATLTEPSPLPASMRRSGTLFLHLLAGKMVYRQAGRLYTMRPGDSLMFEGDAPHGPEALLETPVRLLSIVVRREPESLHGLAELP